MTPSNFLRQLRDLRATGEGIYRDVQIPLNTFTGALGAAIGAIGMGDFGFAAVETNGLAIQWAATDVTEVHRDILVPEDYDEESDELYLQLLAQMGGATDTPDFVGDAYLKRAGAALGSDLITVDTDALSATAAWVQFDLSGNSLAGGDMIGAFVKPATHGTDAVNLYGAKLRYKGTLVSYDVSDRA